MTLVAVRVTDLSLPVPNVCQSPHCEPNPNPTRFSQPSFSPLILTTTSGRVVVSIQLSFGGVRSTVPIQANTANGLILIDLLATVCVTNAVAVYGNVIRSPVF